MALKTVTMNGMEVTQPNHINIHIHQESGVTVLFKACGALKNHLASWPGDSPVRARVSYGLLALGVTHILLGALSCVLGGFLYLGPWNQLLSSGCGFWAGSVAIAAGVGTIIHEKYRGKVSGWGSVLLALVGVATAVGALFFCVSSLAWQDPGFPDADSVCARPRPESTTPYYRRRWNSYNSYSPDWREEECRNYVATVKRILLALRALLLVVCALQAMVSLASLGLGVRLLCGRSSSLALEDEGSEKKLLGENSAPPSPYKEKNMTAITP
ncbi:transmembrane protein 176B [Erinaceus europaeus]|uniref:Transmembrane protein 176B n=1 Tax=Erinaceus europaeus TaxID=9365 RepID=A0A1S3WW21_ERIEU|nr:transmembrane protein 176B [Erinaceus europaeus]XP_016050560.1 transmembrane protein 176B [Erinaceus europaeus]XP_016050561.1 transmembrane protein 176B [Erinaceus europaeus]